MLIKTNLTLVSMKKCETKSPFVVYKSNQINSQVT